MNKINIQSFAVVRSVSKTDKSEHPAILLQTEFISKVAEAIQGSKNNQDQINRVNELAKEFVKSGRFLAGLEDAKRLSDKFAGSEYDDTYNAILQDNILMRTIGGTSDTTVSLQLINDLKNNYVKRKGNEKLNPEDIDILVPEGIYPSLPSEKQPIASPVSNEDSKKREETLAFAKLQKLEELKESISILKKQNVRTLKRTEKTKGNDAIDKILGYLKQNEEELATAEKKINADYAKQNADMPRFIPQERLARVGDTWINSNFINNHLADSPLTPAFPDEPDFPGANETCNLKDGLKIADLKTIDIETVAYRPSEIAHINNVQPAEKQFKKTRRLKRSETFESYFQEDEFTKETDTQSTERFSIERSAQMVAQEQQSFNANAEVSASYGLVSGSLSTGFGMSQSQTNSNSTSQNYAKEFVQRVIDRTSQTIRKERSFKTAEEFEEIVKHEVNNEASNVPKSYVYRWLNKLVRGTLKNYGKRLMLEINIAHPSHYYLSRLVKDDTGNDIIGLPVDPRKLVFPSSSCRAGEKVLPYFLMEYNYIEMADTYKTQLGAPPEEIVTVSKSEAVYDDNVKKALKYEMEIPPGYTAKECSFIFTQDRVGGTTQEPNDQYMRMFIGTVSVYDRSRVSTIPSNYAEYDKNNTAPGALASSTSTIKGTMTLDNQENKLSIVVTGGTYHFSYTVEVKCERKPELFREWQQKSYYSLIEGYDALKEAAESKKAGYSLENIGMHPLKKKEFVRTELKREALRKMLDCNPLGASFLLNDEYKLPNEYELNCCLDNSNAKQAAFLEEVFDWNNMTFSFRPYYYTKKDFWIDLLKLEDEDPLFETFLKSSYVTLQIPVHRDENKEKAAINFIYNNSINNLSTVPNDARQLLNDLRSQQAVFTVDINNQPIPTPTSSTDIGYFEVATDLVILEKGTEDGVEVRPYPESSTAPTTSVAIPMVYSPGIITN